MPAVEDLSRPPSRKRTRVATSRAKRSSWVTTTIVMPFFARSFITSRTSPTISGSSAEVGSSKSITFGSIASERTMATRCFCPPESCCGYALALSSRPTRRSSSIAFLSASAADAPRTSFGASVMLSRIVRWGKRLKCWKTMPISLRTRFFVLSSALTMSIPSKIIEPSVGCSRRFMHRRNVDLPPPDGPIITTTSPLRISVESPFSTSSLPKLFFRFSILSSVSDMAVHEIFQLFNF